MHPSGVQFGLSRGLLQLRGEEVKLHPAMSRLRITVALAAIMLLSAETSS